MLRSKMVVDNQRTKPSLKSQNQPIKRKAEVKKAKIEVQEKIEETKPQVQDMSFDSPMDVSMQSLTSDDSVDDKVIKKTVDFFSSRF